MTNTIENDAINFGARDLNLIPEKGEGTIDAVAMIGQTGKIITLLLL